jgi:hypothetical protein
VEAQVRFTNFRIRAVAFEATVGEYGLDVEVEVYDIGQGLDGFVACMGLALLCWGGAGLE